MSDPFAELNAALPSHYVIDRELGRGGMALVYLARLNSLAILPFAFFFSFLLVGGASMPRRADVPSYYIEILEGLMLIFFACSVFVERRLTAGGRRVRADEVERAAVSPATAGGDAG